MKSFNKKKTHYKQTITNVEIVLDHIYYTIPQKYIRLIKKHKNLIKELRISKDYLNVMGKYTYSCYEQDIKEIFITNERITQIFIGDKQYFTPYIDYICNMDTDNLLQQTRTTDKEIIFTWDLSKNNRVDFSDYPIVKISISKKYKDKILLYDKVILK